MTSIPTLETDRLTLRAPQAEDFPLYRDFYADAEGSGNYGGPLRPDEAFRRLAADIGHWHLRGFGKWIIVFRQTGTAVGGCGLWHPMGWPRHELTWWLLRAFRGQGIATEASRAVILFAHRTLGWDRVETHMRDTNQPARRLAERLGGTVTDRVTFPDGVTRDVFLLPEGAA
ncbi:GNAT family N-acetyltransferase [Aestuariibius sp. 2305UL40-4]|uniref:GNAT family N-acetyltransferase n=1 Tax=Aestuariibius violaceus TaxID=3234132 RepID=UPI00345ECE2A